MVVGYCYCYWTISRRAAFQPIGQRPSRFQELLFLLTIIVLGRILLLVLPTRAFQIDHVRFQNGAVVFHFRVVVIIDAVVLVGDDDEGFVLLVPSLLVVDQHVGLFSWVLVEEEYVL